MTHTPHDQKLLDSMTDQEKLDRTKPIEMRKRGIVVREWRSWILCHNEYPDPNRWEEQYVLRRRDTRVIHEWWYEFWEITRSYRDYTILRNKDKDKSVKEREHRHIFK